uniref:Uncharacterized protein n=1 Tax=Candidatus Kentrum sp. FW TaxID=2126338 RepID=A0A450U418_9GAMM|nr:MAG: hypothetical protein BECKFW1821C_GA0114237_11544 [Candidatus Kentron sp. FW]
MPLPMKILEYGEKRFVTLEMDDPGRLLVIAYTWRGDNIRIISARKAERSERKLLSENVKNIP